MKTLLVTLMLCVFVFVGSSNAFDAVFGTSAGKIIQNGEHPTWSYGFDVSAPVVSDSTKNYKIVTSFEVFYADRALEDLSEIEGLKVMTTGKKSFFDIPVFINLGTGFWRFTNTAGENKESGCYRIGLSAELFGLDIFGLCDIVPQTGADLYNPVIGFKLLTM